MAWVRIDDHFDEHPKLAKVGPLGWGIWLAGLSYCNRNLTDGFIPRSKAHILASFDVVDEGSGQLWNLSRTCGMTGDDIDASWIISVLVNAGIWDEVPGGYQIHDYSDYQPTKAQVIEERERKVAAGKAGGQASAEARAQASAKGRRKPRAQAESKQNPTPNPNPSVSDETEPPIPPTGVEPPWEKSNLDERWDRFWDAYPRHTATGAAEKAFRKLNPSDELTDRMIVAVEAVKQTHNWTKDNGQFIPLATTWLNQDRWRDEPVSIVPAGPPNVELMPGETAEQVGPGEWNLVGRDGQVRKIRPDYCGVIFDTRKHLYEGLNTFTDEVAKAREGKHGHANTGD